MQIKLSRAQWEFIGKKAGWMNLTKKAMVEETPEEAAKRISELPAGMNYSAAQDILSAAEGDQDSLDMLKEYYPTWRINDFQRCKEILNGLGIE